MLALLVTALVPTVVMTAALALESFERCVLRHVSLDRAHVDRRATPPVGNSNVAAPVVPEIGTTFDQQ